MQTWKTRFQTLAVLLVTLILCAALPASVFADDPIKSEYEIFTVDPYDGPGLTTDLTVIALDADGNTIDSAKVGQTYRSGSTMTITIAEEYRTKYELNGITGSDGVLITEWSGDFTSSNEITFTWSAINKEEATIYLNITEATHVLQLKNDDGSIDMGTITYKDGGKQQTTVEVYLNYEKVCTFPDLNISNALGNFILDVKDGYYFDTVNMQDITFDSDIEAQTFTYQSTAGQYTKLNFGMVPSLISGKNTVRLYFFNYNDGIKTDFTRYINTNAAHPSLDAACDTLNISFNYQGTDYAFPYDSWSQIGAVYLPSSTDITVEAQVKDGFYFEYWMSEDGWTEGNDLFTILSDGTWRQETTGIASLQHGRVAFSQTMGMNFSALGYKNAQIGLYLTDGGLVEDLHRTITYKGNYTGAPADHVQYFYYLSGTGYGTVILDSMFDRDGFDFIGWNTKADGTGTWYDVDSAYGSNGEDDLILYAQWEENGGTPTPTYSAKVWPADITIYMGGENGYAGAADESGTAITGNNSLPEPGYYIELPSVVNDALKAAGAVTGDTPVDLSKYITIRAEDGIDTYEWTLAPYGDTYSVANGKFIYAFVPKVDTDTQSFRLNFINNSNKEVSDEDHFDLTTSLSQTYTIQIYQELVQAGKVYVDVSIPATSTTQAVSYRCTMTTDTGNMTVRYVNGSQDEVVTHSFNSVAAASDADDKGQDALNKAYVIRDEDTPFYINGSHIDVNEQGNFADVSLLFDSIVPGYESNLAEAAIDAVQDTGIDFKNVKYEAKYLDLVDSNNGNVWLTTDKDVTIYWPYPEGTDADTDFTIVHFDGLDRQLNLNEIETSIENANLIVIDNVQTDEYGISFTTHTFSPYVLLWDDTQTTTVIGTPTPGPVSTSDDHPDIAEAIANGTWGQPTPTPAPAVIPQTSDDMPITLLIGAAGIAAAGIVVLVILRKRKRNQ